MIFREFPERLLGSKVKVKTIMHLFSEGAVVSERETAAILDVSHTAVVKTLKELHDLNLISPMRAGNVILWSLNKESYAYGFLINFSRMLKNNPKESIEIWSSPLAQLSFILLDYLEGIEKVNKVIIFGSVAEGKETANSDIDLFILVEDNKTREKIKSSFDKKVGEILQIFGNRPSLNIMTLKEYERFENKKLLENIKKGIVVLDR